MSAILFIVLALTPCTVIAATCGLILNILRAARGNARPLPTLAYWDPNHPLYREPHTVYLATEPQNGIRIGRPPASSETGGLQFHRCFSISVGASGGFSSVNVRAQRISRPA